MPANLSSVFSGAGISGSSFDGVIGVNTASFFMLDPLTSTVPIEPIADIIPGITPFRTTFDVIDQESYTQNYRVTSNTLQDFSDVISNVHKDLVQIAIQGTLVAAGPLVPSIPFLGSITPPPPPTFGGRLDLMRAAFLQQLADLRRPIMVVTPRVSLARCFIASINRPWTPADSNNTIINILLIEARVASPFSVGLVPDLDALAAGNSATTGGGQQSATPVQTPPPTNSSTSQLAPTW